jgi:hypothetical protein
MTASNAGVKDSGMSLVDVDKDTQEFWDLEVDFKGWLNNVHPCQYFVHSCITLFVLR